MTRAVRITIDGEPRVLEGEPNERLVEVARRAGATRLVVGCADGRCGSCRAIVDGALVATCRVTLDAVSEGAVMLTARSLEATAPASAAIEAFTVEREARCRMCVGALGVTAWVLARDLARGAAREERTEELLREATCMCTGRGSWRRALGVVK